MSQTNAISCREFVRQSTELLERSLDTTRHKALETHRDSCPHCRRYVQQIETLVGWSAHLKTTEKPSKAREKELMGAIGGLDREVQDASFVKAGQEHADSGECSFLGCGDPERFLEDSFPDDVQVGILNHLIEGCETCSSRCRKRVYPGLEDYQGVRRKEREPTPTADVRAQYEALLAGLISARPGKVQETPIGLAPRSVGFVHWLIREGRERLAREPADCQQLAELATEASVGLPPMCRVRAAMFRGHVARKALTDFVEADIWFNKAEAELHDIPGSEIILAKLLRMRALARYVQSRYSEALALLDQAELLYLELGEFARIGESALDRAAIEMELKGPNIAISTVLRSTPLIDWADSVRYSMAATQNLAVYYAESGRPSRAASVLQLSRKRLLLMGEPAVDKLLLDWVEGKILNSQGDYAAAAGLLRETRHRFLDLDLSSQCAFVSLDLACSLLELGRPRELAEICQPMIAYFLSRGITGEALMTTRLFQRALLEQSLTLIHIRTLNEVLSREPRL